MRLSPRKKRHILTPIIRGQMRWKRTHGRDKNLPLTYTAKRAAYHTYCSWAKNARKTKICICFRKSIHFEYVKLGIIGFQSLYVEKKNDYSLSFVDFNIKETRFCSDLWSITIKYRSKVVLGHVFVGVFVKSISCLLAAVLLKPPSTRRICTLRASVSLQLPFSGKFNYTLQPFRLFHIHIMNQSTFLHPPSSPLSTFHSYSPIFSFHVN